MSYFEKQFQTSLDNNITKRITPKNKNLTFRKTRYLKQQFCPFQKYVDHRPNPYRPLTKSSSNVNLFNHPIQKEKYISCYKFIDRNKLYPLITRNDLSKYFKNDSILLKHKKPCYSCNKINEGNYGRNYYSVFKKSFPFVKGNFCGEIKKFVPRYNTPAHSRNQVNKIKDRFFQEITNKYNNNYTTEDTYRTKNMFKNIYDMEKKEEQKEEHKEEQKEEQKNEKEEFNLNEFLKKNENKKFNVISRNSTSSYFYRPMTRKRFHKTQIFDNCKPFLVDEFKEYGEYK